MNVFRILVLVLQFFKIVESYWWSIATTNLSDFSIYTLMKQHRFSRGQRLMIETNKKMLQHVWTGAAIALRECKKQFKDERWNCPNSSSSTIFGKILNKACRETSFIHAITSAGVTYSLTEFCAQGLIKGCHCREGNRSKVRNGNSVIMEGCHDNIKYGYFHGKLFTDGAETSRDFRSIVNLHNNEAGRLAVIDTMQVHCKCHGVSGNCNLKTCRKTLSQFDKVGFVLKEKYNTASKVESVQIGGNRRIGRDNLAPAKETFLAPTEQDLVYYEDSPNFCKRDLREGSLGISGRYCNASLQAKGVDGCEILCCGGKWKTQNLTRNERCKCLFKWCCDVKCQQCRVTREYSYCL
nr:Wnt1 protein [Cladonema pacificum]